MENTLSAVAWELMDTLFCSRLSVEADDCPSSINSFSWEKKKKTENEIEKKDFKVE